MDCCAWSCLVLNPLMTFDNFGDGAAGRTFCVAEIVVRLVRLVMSAVVSLVLTQSVSFDFLDCCQWLYFEVLF